MQDDELKFKVTVKFGHCDVQSWLEMKDGRLVGMGSRTCYDDEGIITEHSTTETGIVVAL